MIWKILFSLLGLFSLGSILHSYGFAELGRDILGLGWWSVPIALSFLPVAICYATAWHLVTPEMPARRFPRFIAFSVIAVAWNNLSPFVKVLGEAARVHLLTHETSKKSALKSVVLYNLVHIIGTILAFIIGAAIIIFHFPVSSGVRIGFVSLIAVFTVLLLLIYFLPNLPLGARRGHGRVGLLLKIRFSIRWALSKIRMFSKQHPNRFWVAVFIEVAVRFIEGITFYIAFLALGEPVSAFYSALLDVGRALMDNAFFFIPYQVGSREAGLVLLSEHVIPIGKEAAVGAAVFYRLVEILWMAIGYALWMIGNKSRKAST